MDIVTQGIVGAAVPMSSALRVRLSLAGGAGFLAGLAPDLDVLIRSSSDSLLFLEYHRQFTHSLFFIPIGGGLVSLILFKVLGSKSKVGFLRLWLVCSLGFGTHGLLDAATSYGTQLLWPFDTTRYSLSVISIVDPLFTVPIAVCVILSIWLGKKGWAIVGLFWGFFYLGLGVAQKTSALSLAKSLATSRGHVIDKIEIKPSFGNLVLWRSVYRFNGRFYVDSVRPHIKPNIIVGSSAEALDVAKSFSLLSAQSQQAKDIGRFFRFSNGYVSRIEGEPNRLSDIRYSFLPNSIEPLWSIRVRPGAPLDAHVLYETNRGNAFRNLKQLLRMVLR